MGSECFVQQRLARWIAADNAIECHDGGGRNLRPDINEVAVREFDDSKPIAACRFLGRSRKVHQGRINGDHALDATVEQFETQSADSGADIEQDAPDRIGADKQVAK